MKLQNMHGKRLVLQKKALYTLSAKSTIDTIFAKCA